MLKCSRCGQYYVPGYLECHCQIMLHTLQAATSGQFPGDKVTLTAGEFPLSSAAAMAPTLPHSAPAPNRAAAGS